MGKEKKQKHEFFRKNEKMVATCSGIQKMVWKLQTHDAKSESKSSTNVTYGPRKAVAEVSNHREPIGRKSKIQLVRKSVDFTFSCFVLN